jgi:nucleotide-binding universal stress UspA family protein
MYKDILVPVDLDDENSWKASLSRAVEFAQAFGSRLHVLTVVPDFGATMVAQYFPQDYEQKIVQEARQRLHTFTKDHVPDGVEVQHLVGHGRVYDEILRMADEADCDLICMASHRPELRDYLLGPNAARVVRHATRSVLVVRDAPNA